MNCLFLIAILFQGLASTDFLSFQTKISKHGLSSSQVIERVNQWAVNNSQTHSSIVQGRDSTSINIRAITSVLVAHQGKHTVRTEVQQERYSYQIDIKCLNEECTAQFKNYLSEVPNSKILTTKTERLNYIKKLPQSGKRKRILAQFAESEYTQLERSAEIVARQLQAAVL